MKWFYSETKTSRTTYISLYSITQYSKKQEKKEKKKIQKTKKNIIHTSFYLHARKTKKYLRIYSLIYPTYHSTKKRIQSQRTSNYISTTKINEEEDDDNNYENIFTTLRNKPNTLPFQKHFPPTIFFLLFNVNIFLFSTTYALTYFYDYDNCTLTAHPYLNFVERRENNYNDDPNHIPWLRNPTTYTSRLFNNIRELCEQR